MAQADATGPVPTGPHRFAAGDYVSPNFKTVRPDHCFPNMILGDTHMQMWPWLRREIPHNWYVDRRLPTMGFLSRDEAHIVYNTALQFAGMPPLEVGCWMGWSACHMALAGALVDVIDPMLGHPEVLESVRQSLTCAGIASQVTLFPGHSPAAVSEIVRQFNRRWPLIFIDGNHDGDAPLNDARVCELHADGDALVLFHDLAAPPVAAGLNFYRDRGWSTVIYQTMQIMGAAWRGAVEPVRHRPDPSVKWELPAHLAGYAVSAA